MKTVIEMAREAGWWTMSRILRVRLERFAELVRADERERAMRENAYVALEREACARVCDDIEMKNTRQGAADCAAAIRNRTSS